MVWSSLELAMMHTRLKPSMFHFLVKSLSSVRLADFNRRWSWLLLSSIIDWLYIFASYSLSLTITPSSISINVLSSNDFIVSFLPNSLFLFFSKISSSQSISNKALTIKNSLYIGKKLVSLIKGSRLRLRYSISNSLAPSISSDFRSRPMISSIFIRFRKRATSYTVQSLLLNFRMRIYWVSFAK